MTIVLYILDWIATVPIDVCYFLRLRILLLADLSFRKYQSVIKIVTLGFLIIPVTWIVVDIIGILSIFSTSYNVAAAYVFGIWNIGLAINEIIMHSFFVGVIIRHIRRRAAKDMVRLIFLSIFVVLNSGILLAGGVVNIYNSQIGSTLAYSSWLVNVWVFLALNATVNKFSNDQGDTSQNGIRKTSSPAVEVVMSEKESE